MMMPLETPELQLLSTAEILVVEDDAIVAEDTRRSLEEMGYEVADVTRRGEWAVHAAEEHRPDLVLMDIRLAGEMDGVEAGRTIMEETGVPVVFLTAYADPGTRARVREAAPFGYVVKPFSERDLQTAVEVALLRDELERELRESEQRYRSLFEGSPDPISLTTPDGRFLSVNQAFVELFGYDREELSTLPVEELYADPDDRERFLAAVEESGGVTGFETRLLTRTGEVRVCRLSSSEHRGPEGEVEHVQSIFRDVTEREKLQRQLRHQALHDPLTGLGNRTLFEDRIEQALSRARRREQLLGVLIIDLDRFGRINDSLGHSAGDRVLEEVGQRLIGTVRKEDTVARWGGDEFIVLLEGLEGLDDVVTYVDRLEHVLSQPLRVAGRELEISATVGAALFGSVNGPEEAVEVTAPEELVRYADQALRTASERGRNGFHVFHPERNRTAAQIGQLQKEQDLRRGLAAGEFEAFYQAHVRLDTGEVWGVEPLARWRHPERGLVGPADFIPLAEETGLIHELGHVILAEACGQVAEWNRRGAGEGELRVTPNVSGRQFEDEALLEHLEEELDGTGLDPGLLYLEVTETSIMRATHRIEHLRALGARMLVDDFGTGYSSLVYLRDLAVDGLKIDMSFIQGLGEGTGNTAIVETILTLGDEMDLDVIAEGIETEEQLHRLRGMGCEIGQGFLFGRPMPAAEMGRRLESGETLGP